MPSLLSSVCIHIDRAKASYCRISSKLLSQLFERIIFPGPQAIAGPSAISLARLSTRASSSSGTTTRFGKLRDELLNGEIFMSSVRPTRKAPRFFRITIKYLTTPIDIFYSHFIPSLLFGTIRTLFWRKCCIHLLSGGGEPCYFYLDFSRVVYSS